MVMKHDAHPLLLAPVSALFVGCALPALDMNLVDVCVSMAGPVVLVVETRAVVVGATGVAAEVGNKVLDEAEDEDEDGVAFALEEEEEDVDKGGAGAEVVTGGDGVEEGGLVALCWGQSGQSIVAHKCIAHGGEIGGPAQSQ
jgi:hypothetical protein